MAMPLKAPAIHLHYLHGLFSLQVNRYGLRFTCNHSPLFVRTLRPQSALRPAGPPFLLRARKKQVRGRYLADPLAHAGKPRHSLAFLPTLLPATHRQASFGMR